MTKKNGWAKRKGNMLGTGVLNNIKLPFNSDGWVVFRDDQKFIRLEFPIDLKQEQQRELLKIVNSRYKRLAATENKMHKNIRTDWGRMTNATEIIAVRNKEMKKIYSEYKAQGESRQKCIYQVNSWLKKQSFWKGRKGYKVLSGKTIERICYSKK